MMYKKLRSPIQWFGGKGNMTAKLLPLIPKHHTYVEVFGGGASLLFAKHPSPVEVYNDIDGELVNIFRVIRDPKQFKKFYRLVSSTPYSREEYNHCRTTYNKNGDPIERAYQFFIIARMSFSGRWGGSFSTSVTASSRGMSDPVNSYLQAIKHLPEIHSRLMRVQIENQPWQTILDRYDTPETFFYLDPPYPQITRKSGKYKHEMTTEDHQDLCEILLGIEGQAMISSYPNEIYKPLIDAGWFYKEWETACYAATRTRASGILGKGASKKMQPRTECIYLKTRENGNLLFRESSNALDKL